VLEEVDERLIPEVAVDVRLEPERDELVEQRSVFDSHQSPRGEPRLRTRREASVPGACAALGARSAKQGAGVCKASLIKHPLQPLPAPVAKFDCLFLGLVSQFRDTVVGDPHVPYPVTDPRDRDNRTVFENVVNVASNRHRLG
jgi:hypothetical protein